MSIIRSYRIEATDPRMGRTSVVHDDDSRRFVAQATDVPTKRFRHRIYNPAPLPEQIIGNCTGVDQCVKLNSAPEHQLGNRVLKMKDAVAIYTRATELDDFPGTYPQQDTGSNGLSACKAAQALGLVSRYEWIFGGRDPLLAALRLRPVGMGTVWFNDMFHPDPESLLVTPTGGVAGGHEWSLIGWDPYFRAFEGFCWWGPTFGSHGVFRIREADLQSLRDQDGDAHQTYAAWEK